MAIKKKKHIILMEDAVFRLDKNGRWHNQYGPFKHPKIIRFFHSAIKKDQRGFFLEQELEGSIEKVYFPYEDTALFVFDVIMDENMTLILNTGKHILLEPNDLFIRGDNLYTEYEKERVKFVDRGLKYISEMIDEQHNRYYICYRNNRYWIKEKL